MSENYVSDNCFHFSRILLFRMFFPWVVFFVVFFFLIGKQYRSASIFKGKRIKNKEKENK